MGILNHIINNWLDWWREHIATPNNCLRNRKRYSKGNRRRQRSMRLLPLLGRTLRLLLGRTLLWRNKAKIKTSIIEIKAIKIVKENNPSNQAVKEKKKKCKTTSTSNDKGKGKPKSNKSVSSSHKSMKSTTTPSKPSWINFPGPILPPVRIGPMLSSPTPTQPMSH